jgi:putative intracellular protease/amidase
MKPLKVLFVTTSHDQMGDTSAMTGVWLEELAAPYYIFKDAGAELIIASPKGGLVPLDPKSESIIVATQSTKRFLKDPEAMDFLSHSTLLEDIKADEFDVVFLPGGHGAMWDIAGSEKVKELLEAFNRQNKPMGLLCQAVVALLLLKNEDGEPLIKGKKLTGASNGEEELARLTNILPFLPENQLLSLGALYTKGPDYASHVVVSDNIITGQNASSSKETARQILSLIQKNEEKRPLKIPVDTVV